MTYATVVIKKKRKKWDGINMYKYESYFSSFWYQVLLTIKIEGAWTCQGPVYRNSSYMILNTYNRYSKRKFFH